MTVVDGLLRKRRDGVMELLVAPVLQPVERTKPLHPSKAAKALSAMILAYW